MPKYELGKYRLETKKWYADFEGVSLWCNVLYIGKVAVWILPNSVNEITIQNAIYSYEHKTNGRRL